MYNLIDAILERQLLAIKSKDESNINEYFGYAIDPKKDTQSVVVPRFWLSNQQHAKQLSVFVRNYFVTGLIDVGAIWAPITSIPFTLITFSQTRPSNTLMATFKGNPVDTKQTKNVAKTGKLPEFFYTDEFKQFIQDIQLTLNGEQIFLETNETFLVPFDQIDATKLQISFYHPDNKIDFERYKNAKFEPLLKHAEIFNVSKKSGKCKVFKWSLVDTQAENLPFEEGDSTSVTLQSGDVVVTPSLSRTFVIPEITGVFFAPAHCYVVRPFSKQLTGEYLSLYLKSDIARKYSIRVATGSVFSRVNLKDFLAIPILLPDEAVLKESKDLYQLLLKPETATDKINSLLANRQDKGRLLDSFLLEELNKLRISKRTMIERLIKDDLKELKACIDKGLYKSAMVLCGSVLEAVILDWLSETEKHDYYNDDKEISLNEALSNLNKGGQLNRETLDAAHNIRKMRNLIHPRNFLKNQSKVTKAESKRLLEQLKLVIRSYTDVN